MAKAYAEELARHGISIIFVTKDHASVRDTAASLSQSYGVETVIILADFSLDQAASKPIKEALRGKDIGFLVNCVDEALSSPQSLIEMPEQSLLELVNKNVAVATLMTRLVLPGMVERSRGAVVNISSGSCCRPLPGRVTLTAATVRQNTQCICLLPSIHTKIHTLHCLMSHSIIPFAFLHLIFQGYLDHFSRALHMEYSGRGIFVQSLIPFQVNFLMWPLQTLFFIVLTKICYPMKAAVKSLSDS